MTNSPNYYFFCGSMFGILIGVAITIFVVWIFELQEKAKKYDEIKDDR